MVSKVSEETTDADIYFVDVDQSMDLASQFGVRSIPTMVLLKDGGEANRSVGAITEEQVKAFVHS